MPQQATPRAGVMGLEVRDTRRGQAMARLLKYERQSQMSGASQMKSVLTITESHKKIAVLCLLTFLALC